MAVSSTRVTLGILYLAYRMCIVIDMPDLAILVLHSRLAYVLMMDCYVCMLLHTLTYLLSWTDMMAYPYYNIVTLQMTA